MGLRLDKGRRDDDDHHRKRKKKKRSRSNSSSSSSSDGEVGSPNRKYMQWTGPDSKERDKSVSTKLLLNMEGMRFKRRSDLTKFATRYPGALGALFLVELSPLVAAEVEVPANPYFLWAAVVVMILAPSNLTLLHITMVYPK